MAIIPLQRSNNPMIGVFSEYENDDDKRHTSKQCPDSAHEHRQLSCQSLEDSWRDDMGHSGNRGWSLHQGWVITVNCEMWLADCTCTAMPRVHAERDCWGIMGTVEASWCSGNMATTLLRMRSSIQARARPHPASCLGERWVVWVKGWIAEVINYQTGNKAM